MDTITDTRNLRRIDRTEAFDLAAREYRNLLSVLQTLSADEWTLRTDCPDWDVREMGLHVLGACHSCASKRQLVHQLRGGKKWAKQHGRPEIDGINAVQVADRQHLTAEQLLVEFEKAIDPAVKGRKSIPSLVRRIDVGDGSGGPMKLGWLMEVIYTRDTWMHRVDVLRAVGRLDTMHLTREHDGRIVTDVIAQWASEHSKPFTLHLDGPAGGHFRQGSGGPELHLDTVEFMRTMSGRAAGEGLLAHTVLF